MYFKWSAPRAPQSRTSYKCQWSSSSPARRHLITMGSTWKSTQICQICQIFHSMQALCSLLCAGLGVLYPVLFPNQPNPRFPDVKWAVKCSLSYSLSCFILLPLLLRPLLLSKHIYIIMDTIDIDLIYFTDSLILKYKPDRTFAPLINLSLSFKGEGLLLTCFPVFCRKCQL